MAKILYIEDELVKSIDTIEKFFSPIIGVKNFKKDLAALKDDERTTPEDVLRICNQSSILEVCHTFPMALDRIINNHNIYDLIIIDRDLSDNDYSDNLTDVVNMLNTIGLEYDDDRLQSFFEREGDLLLLILLRMNPTYKQSIYYLTGNTKDDLRVSNGIQDFIEVNFFTNEHIIEKGSPNEIKIADILSNLNKFKIQNQYIDQCNALRRHDEYLVEQFLCAIEHYNSGRWEDFASNLRKLLHNLLTDIASAISDPARSEKEAFWDDYNNLKISDLLMNSDYGLPRYSIKVGYNKIIRNFCISLHFICSAYGAHDDEFSAKDKRNNNPKSNNLSSYTVNALLNQICEIILWYDKALDLIPK